MAGSTTKLPFTEKEYKIPGYTGFVPGVQETYKKTPVMAQLECKDPAPESFIYTRTMVSPKTDPARDPCNDPENFKKATPGNLWPVLQDKAIQDQVKPPVSAISFGDLRIDVFRTSYSTDYKALLPGHDRLRSPNRNEDLAITTASLKDIYYSAYNRVGDKRLQKMIGTMRERLSAKMGNNNDNGFRFRKLFQMYDTHKTGMVHVEDFRNMCETFGMQLDDDSLLALYYVYDPEGTGFLTYHTLVRQLMDPDCYALYADDAGTNTAKVAHDKMQKALKSLSVRMAPILGDIQKGVQLYDPNNTGFVTRHDLIAACAGLGVVLPDSELVNLTSLLQTDAEGKIAYMSFISLFANVSPSPSPTILSPK